MTQRIQAYFPPLVGATPVGEAKGVTREQKIYDLALRKQAPEAETVRLYSGRVEQVHNVISDISSILRFAAYLDPKIATHPALAIEGVTTGFSAFLGLKTAVVSAQEISKALEIKDYKGVLDQVLGVAAGSSQALAGLDYLAVRVASVVAVLQPGNTALASALNALTSAGDGLFGALYGIWAVWSGIKVVQGEMFCHKVEKQGDASAQLAYLQRRVNVTAADALKHLAKTWKDAGRATLIEEAQLTPEHLEELRKLSKGDEELFDGLLKNAALMHSLQETGAQQLAKGCAGLKQATVDLETFVRKVYSVEDLTLIGLAVETDKMDKRRHAKLNRMIGETCVKKIKEANPAKNEEVAPALMNEVLESVKTKRMINVALGIASVLGVAAMIASAVVTAGIVPIVATAVLLLVSLIFLGVDGYALYQALKNSEPGATDKMLLWISSAVCFALMATAVAVTTVFSLGFVPLAVAGAIGIGWLGVTLFAIYRSNDKEKALKQLKKLLLAKEYDGAAVQKAFAAFVPETQKEILKVLHLSSADEFKKCAQQPFFTKRLNPAEFDRLIAEEKAKDAREIAAHEAARLQELQELYDSAMSQSALGVKEESVSTAESVPLLKPEYV